MTVPLEGPGRVRLCIRVWIMKRATMVLSVQSKGRNSNETTYSEASDGSSQLYGRDVERCGGPRVVVGVQLRDLRGVYASGVGQMGCALQRVGSNHGQAHEPAEQRPCGSVE